MNRVILLFCYLSDQRAGEGNLAIVHFDDELCSLIRNRRDLFLYNREKDERLSNVRYWNADALYYHTDTPARLPMPQDENELSTRMEKILDKGEDTIVLYELVEDQEGYIEINGYFIDAEPDRMEDQEMILTISGISFSATPRHHSHTSCSVEIPYEFLFPELKVPTGN